MCRSPPSALPAQWVLLWAWRLCWQEDGDRLMMVSSRGSPAPHNILSHWNHYYWCDVHSLSIVQLARPVTTILVHLPTLSLSVTVFLFPFLSSYRHITAPPHSLSFSVTLFLFPFLSKQKYLAESGFGQVPITRQGSILSLSALSQASTSSFKVSLRPTLLTVHFIKQD